MRGKDIFPPASLNLKQIKRCNVFLMSFKKYLLLFSPDTAAIIYLVGTQIYFCIFVNKQANTCRNNSTFQVSQKSEHLSCLTQAASGYLEQMRRYGIGYSAARKGRWILRREHNFYSRSCFLQCFLGCFKSVRATPDHQLWLDA